MKMVYLKVLTLALLSSLATCEPPVHQGYNYNRPQPFAPPAPTYAAPSTAYGPPQNSYQPPQNSYLPPQNSYNSPQTSFLPPPGQNYQSGYDQSSYNNYDQSGHYDHGHSGHDHHGHENEVPKSYEFGYSVKDAHSGNDYGRQESSDGNTVRGEYRVALPDGRTQIVTYHADWKTGFHADVRYEGEARYPEPSHNNYQQGGYNYNAPSDYHGSLTGFQQRPSTSYGPPGYHR